ncbi:MAG: ABC-2 transporter permease [Oscillospiraceae bacterium]|nr:ABC-2 transporter permease [Oscillospiraceae bacterium]
MKGLLLKDLYTLTKQLKLFLLLLFASAFLPGMSTFGTVYAALLPMTALAYDERSKWDRLAAMMPYSARQLVLSKYVLGYLLVGGSALLSLAARPLAGLFLKSSPAYATLPMGVLLALLALALTLPPVFRLGVEKGRLVCIVLVMACAFGGIRAENSLSGLLTQERIIALLPLALLCVAALSLLSIALSARFYQTRYGAKTGQ